MTGDERNGSLRLLVKQDFFVCDLRPAKELGPTIGGLEVLHQETFNPGVPSFSWTALCSINPSNYCLPLAQLLFLAAVSFRIVLRPMLLPRRLYNSNGAMRQLNRQQPAAGIVTGLRA